MENHSNEDNLNNLNSFLDYYITIDGLDKIEFQSILAHDLIKSERYYEHGIFIILEIMFKMNNFGLECQDVDEMISDLIAKVNDYSSKNQYDLACRKLFYRQYTVEIDFLIDYLEKAYQNNHVPDEFNQKNIKNNLNHLSKQDLCYILGLNLDLTFDKEKNLKNMICDKLMEFPFDYSILKDVEPEVIKNYLDNPYELKKFPLTNTLQKDFKQTYSWIYDIQNELETNFNSNNDDFAIREMKRQDDAFKRRYAAKKRGAANYQIAVHNEIERNIRNEKKRKQIKEQSRLEQDKIEEQNQKNLDRSNREYETLEFERLINNWIKQEQQSSINLENQRRASEVARKNRERNDKRIKEYNEKKRKDFNRLIEVVKEFNKKPISELINLKDDFKQTYMKLQSLNQNTNHSEDIKKFFSMYHYDSDQFKLLKNHESDLENFIKIINLNNYLDYDNRQNLINNYSKIYERILNIDNSFFENVCSDIRYLKEFKKGYSDLINYTTFSETNDNNVIKIHNKKYLDNEFFKYEDLFEDISDPAKKTAIVMNDKNIKVVAGAGTGKTFTIQSKVKYLVEGMNVNPEKILCLCYTHKSASELDERVNDTLEDSKVEVCTFHEFARRVDRACGGIKSINRYLLDDIIRKYIKKIIKNPKKSDELFEYFTYYFNPNIEEEYDSFKEFKDKHPFNTLQQKFNSYIADKKELEKFKSNREDNSQEKYISYGIDDETLHGEKVRSLGEMIIANYLFTHNINYEYEPRYEKNHFAKFIKDRFFYSGKYFSLKEFNKKSKKEIVEHFIRYETRKAAYKPDFYLPGYEIYLEHFGVNEKDEVTWLKGSDKEQYERLMRSKRVWHEIYGTKLIETYSYYVREGTLIEKLEKLLKENNVAIGKRDTEEILKILLVNSKVGEYSRFSKLIKNFINIFEANNYPKNKLKQFKEDNKKEPDLFTRKRQDLFLTMVSEIYEEYCRYNQGNDIDHNREISNALELIKNKEYNRKFDYILIDEYQDINHIRCELIQELQKKSNAHVFVVGDDWQSIYGFGGSNVKLFIDFDKYFPHSEKIKLTENRRNSQTINNISRKFIMQNTNQENKNLKCLKENYNENPVKLVSYSNEKYSKAIVLDAILQDILANSTKDKLKILILGRMNEDIEGYINNRLFKEKQSNKFRKIVYAKDKNLDITFMSIHQSKGLQYDEVIVLNLEDDTKGFPSKIVDDPILKFVKQEQEKYPYAEERRLLYVALTRTKHNVYLTYPQENPSSFITDLNRLFGLVETHLSRNYKSCADIFKDNDFFQHKEVLETDLPCPGCDDGKISVINLKYSSGRKSVFVGCSDYCKNYIGGPYFASIEDMKYIEKCPDPECPGILVRQGDILKCSMNYHGGCMETKELKLDEDDLKYKDFEE